RHGRDAGRPGSRRPGPACGRACTPVPGRRRRRRRSRCVRSCCRSVRGAQPAPYSGRSGPGTGLRHNRPRRAGTETRMAESAQPDYEAIVIGAGVAGIYQVKRLVDLGIHATALEAAADLGGTWYNHRYPGARFDSESQPYGYTFSKEALAEWHWKEHFSAQPENLRYLNFVADRLDLRRHMQFGCRVEAAHFDDAAGLWRLRVSDGRELSCRFVIMAVGLLSTPTLPRIPGREAFRGRAFHTFDWPHEPLDLAAKRVAVIGTGATAIQLIPEVAREAAQLTVFQRRPNCAAPLNNRPISAHEMDEIRARYDEIFATCDRSPYGFVHEPDRRGFREVPREERLAFWDKLYDEPGFAIWLANFLEI